MDLSPGERSIPLYIISDTDSADNTNTKIITRNNGCDIIIDEWEILEAIASSALL